MAPAAWSCSLSDPHTPSTCARWATRSSSTSPTPICRRTWRAATTPPISARRSPASMSPAAGNGARIVINAKGDYEQLAYQSDDQYVVEIQPKRKAATRRRTTSRVYTGEQLTLNFQDIDTRAVLQLLADASGQNIVVSDTVNGSVTLRLQNVPWDQALDIVLRTKGLDKRRDGNVIIVAPAGGARHAREGGPRRQEGYPGTGAAALGVPAGQLRQGRRHGALIKSQGNSLLSSRGNVAVDDRTNTLLLQDTRGASRRHPPAGRDARHSGAAGADRGAHRHRQRRLRARLGARFGFTGMHSNGNNGLVTTTGTAAGTDTRRIRAHQLQTSTAPALPRCRADRWQRAANRYNVNLPVANPGRQHRVRLLGSRLHRRSRAVGRAGRDARRDHLLAARDHREPEGSDHRAGHGDPVSGSPPRAARPPFRSRRRCCRSRSRRRSRRTTASSSISMSRRTASARWS